MDAKRLEYVLSKSLDKNKKHKSSPSKLEEIQWASI